MAERPPYESKFPYSTAPNVVPDEFKDVWTDKLTEWGSMMKQSCVQLGFS